MLPVCRVFAGPGLFHCRRCRALRTIQGPKSLDAHRKRDQGLQISGRTFVRADVDGQVPIRPYQVGIHAVWAQGVCLPLGLAEPPVPSPSSLGRMVRLVGPGQGSRTSRGRSWGPPATPGVSVQPADGEGGLGLKRGTSKGWASVCGGGNWPARCSVDVLPGLIQPEILRRVPGPCARTDRFASVALT